MFLFTLFFTTRSERDVLYHTIYSPFNKEGSEKEINFVPKLAKNSSKIFPELQKTVLNAKNITTFFNNGTKSNKDEHFTDFDDFLFDYNGKLMFIPPKIVNIDINTSKINRFSVKIVNTDSEKEFLIKKVSTKARNIYIEKCSPKVIGPGKRMEFYFSIFFQENGQFSENIIIETNEGKIPFYINYNVNSSNIPEIEDNTLIQRFDKQKTLTIDFKKDSEERCIVYDSSIFDTETENITRSQLSLAFAKNKDIGYYQTFIYVYERNSVYCIPIELKIVEKGVFPKKSSIFFPTVNAKGLYLEKTRLFNALDSEIKITEVSFADKNLPFYYTFDNDSIHANSYGEEITFKVDIGLNFLEVVNYKTQVTISYTVCDTNEKESINIDVNAAAVFYKLITKTSILEQKVNSSVYSFYFENENPCPIVVYSIYSLSQAHQINEFSPTIIYPGNKSNNFSVSMKNNFDLMYSDMNFVFVTNVTKIKVSIKGMNNSMKAIPKKYVSIDRRTNSYNFGRVYAGARKNITYKISNTFYTPFTIKRIECTSGIEVFPLTEVPLTVKPFTAKYIEVAVQFNSMDNNIESISFVGDDLTISTSVSWTPIQGSLKISTNLKENVFYGTKEDIEVKVISTFNTQLDINEFKSNYGTVRNYNVPRRLLKNTECTIANICLDFDLKFYPTRGFFKVINSNSSYDAQVNAWNFLWDKPVTVDYVATFVTQEGQYFVKTIPFNITDSVQPNLSINFGKIHTDEIFTSSVSLSNYFSYPVKYTFTYNRNPLDYNIKFRKSVVIKPHSELEIPIVFEGLKADEYTINIYTTTNVTRPFIIRVLATVEYPLVRFSDIDKNMVTRLDFNGGDDEELMYNKWTKCVYVTNNGLSPLSISNLKITPTPFLKFRANNTNLQPYETCSICFDFSLWMYDRDELTSEILFSILSQRMYYNLPIYINLSKNCLDNVSNSVNQTMKIISIIGITAPVISVIVSLVYHSWFIKELRWRNKRIERAVKHYSVNDYVSVSVQKDEYIETDQTRWIYNRHKNTACATKETVSYMEQLIH